MPSQRHVCLSLRPRSSTILVLHVHIGFCVRQLRCCLSISGARSFDEGGRAKLGHLRRVCMVIKQQFHAFRISNRCCFHQRRVFFVDLRLMFNQRFNYRALTKALLFSRSSAACWFPELAATTRGVSRALFRPSMSALLLISNSIICRLPSLVACVYGVIPFLSSVTSTPLLISF